MILKYIIHSTYDGFLANRDIVCFTANPKGAKTFNSYSDAKSYGNNMTSDKKLTGGAWHVLAIPQI